MVSSTNARSNFFILSFCVTVGVKLGLAERTEKVNGESRLIRIELTKEANRDPPNQTAYLAANMLRNLQQPI